LQRGLESAGHAVDAEYDGNAGEDAVLQGRYEIVVLDVMLPKKDGLAVLRDLRAKGITLPVIILTARDETEDVVAGFNAGATTIFASRLRSTSYTHASARLRGVP